MWAVRDVENLDKPHALMPAAMLPCPQPAASRDWSFQNPVGVDCSSPEPRCIWVAVLRGTTSPTVPPVMPSGHISYQPRVRMVSMTMGCTVVYVPKSLSSLEIPKCQV